MSHSEKSVFVGVELGGTKCVCILGSSPDDIHAQVRVPTTDPDATLDEIACVLRAWRNDHHVAGLGIASFGPIDLDVSSRSYGCITATTKIGWCDTNVTQRLASACDASFAINTDVNAAALAEGEWGAAKNIADFAYITVGTGVGVGLIVQHRPVIGFTHGELGHLRIARAAHDSWPGNCSFHGACVEGLASGPAIAARAGANADTLDDNHPVWQQASDALGQLLHTLVLAVAPRKIILGGGVMMGQAHLLPRVRAALKSSLNGYIAAEILNRLDEYIVAPALGALAGPLGALYLARQASAMKCNKIN